MLLLPIRAVKQVVIEMMVFEGHEVEIIEVNGQIFFNSNHVGICLDFADSTIRDHMSKMSDKHTIKQLIRLS